MAAQDQTLPTRNYQAKILKTGVDAKCRVCGKSDETIDHIVSNCSVLAPIEYTTRHDRVAQYIHWTLCNHYGIETTNRWYDHKPEPVVNIKNITILWDFSIHTDRTIKANRPDIVIKDKQNKTCQLIEVSVPSDGNLATAEFKKLSKYKDLEIEIPKMWKMKTFATPVIIGALGMVKKGTKNYIDSIPGNVSLLEIQKIAITGTAHILRRFLSI